MSLPSITLLNIPNLSRGILVLGLVSLFILGLFFFAIQTKIPYLHDAAGYLLLGAQFKNVGLLFFYSPLRTFAYPWFLYLATTVSEWISVPANFVFFLSQLLVYYVAIIIITKSFIGYSKKLAEAIYLLLCINIFVIPYAGLPLTDSLYTSISIILFAGLIKIEETLRNQNLFYLFLAIGINFFVICTAIVIRPAALWFLVPFSYVVSIAIYKRKMNCLLLILVLIFAAVPLYVQMAINYNSSRVFSFLPVDNLGHMQIKWGIENIKYATWAGKGGAPANYYSSHNLIDVGTHERNIYWYFVYPFQALKLLVFKLVSAFDFDYLTAYPVETPTYAWRDTFFSLTIFILGMVSMLWHLATNTLTILGSRFTPLIIFMSWGGITLFSALELRFVLPLLCYFIISSCVMIHYFITTKNKKLFFIIIFSWIILMPLTISMSHFVRAQSVNIV